MNFWTKVQAGPVDDCWPWLASKFDDGYGCFQLPFQDGRSRARKASRVAWALANGRWPALEELVMHTCDQQPGNGYRKCCNPRHLKLGTNNENMADMAGKGRASQGDEHWTNQRPEDRLRGSAVGNSKLTEEQVRIIKTALACTATNPPRGLKAFLARHFGVTKTLITLIAKDAWWAHVSATECQQFEGAFEEIVYYATMVDEKKVK